MFARSARVIALGLALALSFSLPAHADRYRDAQWWISELGVADAWQTATGKGVTIAVIDTGINGNVPDLTGQVIGGTDVSGVGAANGQTPLGPSESHATQVAALAAGHGVGADGIIGTAPDAKLLSISISFENGTVSADRQISNGVRWAVENGADIIVLSLVMNREWWSTQWDDAFLEAEKANVLVVVAAGNKGSGTDSVGAPATIPGVLVVGGVRQDRRVSTFASTPGSTVTVVAPSEKLPGATASGSRVLWNGTSGAAPIVAGIAALVMQAHPDLDVANVINRIVATADRIGAEGNVDYGFGVIDAREAVQADIPEVTTNPLGTMADWIEMNRADDWISTDVDVSVPLNPEPKVVASENSQFDADIAKSVRTIGLPILIVGGLLASFSGAIYGIIRTTKRQTPRDPTV
jgi:subtilisin family serine protease